MKIKQPIKFDGSDSKIGDLIFEANQRKNWAKYFKLKGKSAEAEIHMKKHKQAVKSLKSLGYDYKTSY